MTERGQASVRRTETRFDVGPSHFCWTDLKLHIHIQERCCPLPYPLKGTVELDCAQLFNEPVTLDGAGKHHWLAVAPQARIHVRFEKPSLEWKGSAYHDMNWGDEPLEQGFKAWTWQRTNGSERTKVFYDAIRSDGSRQSFGKSFSRDGSQDIAPPALHALPKGFWRMPRDVASETEPNLIATLEDSPFYTRNQVSITHAGKHSTAIHESLSLDRFCHPIVQKMVPFRMPRWT
jgi:carotenoid 1,2-hydratase